MNLEARIKKLESQHAVAKLEIPSLPIFWCGNYSNPDYGTCCFWHWRGLPRRNGKKHPLYSWQEKVIKDVESGYTYIYILKPPKIGATELFLSYAIWKSLTDPKWANGQVGVLVGTNKSETEEMISRAKDILAVKDESDRPIVDDDGNKTYRIPIHFSYNNKQQFTINSVKFMAHPAGHYDAIRAKPNMKMIIGDEIAFFVKKKEDQQPIRDAFEHYKGAGLGTIVVLITTAGAAPAGFAWDIYNEEPSMYRKHILGAEAGLEVHPQSGTSILDPIEVEEKRVKTPATYKREFEHKWGHDAGNIWTYDQIENATKIPYEPDKMIPARHLMGVDWGFSDSKFAFTIARISDGILQIVYATEFDKPDFNEMVKHASALMTKYRMDKTYIDGSNPAFIRSLKAMIGERTDYDTAMDLYKAQKRDYRVIMRVVPIYFGQERDELVRHSQALLSEKLVAINEQFKDLLTQMRSAKTKETGMLDKSIGSYDLVDSLFLCLYGVNNPRIRRD